jgi:hypothetical protein
VPKFLVSHLKTLPFDFESEVTEFIKARMSHRFTLGEPAPLAPHWWVESAIKRVPGAEGQPDDFVPDYEIEDDTPPPPTLDQRKHLLAAQLHASAMEAQAAILPPLKARIWNIEYARISAAVAAVPGKPGTVDTPAETSEALRKRALKTLKKEDAEFLLAHEGRLKKLDAIHYQMAKLESEIHDLTEETIDAWKPAPFPGA